MKNTKANKNSAASSRDRATSDSAADAAVHDSGDGAERPRKTARPGATRDPAIKPKAAAAGGTPGFSGKSSKKRAAVAPELSEDYIPGRMCSTPCHDRGCKQLMEEAGYCRLFYIKNWGTIQRKREILAGGQLTRYIEEIVQKYPEKYLEAVRVDLATYGAFQQVVVALELDADLEAATSDEEDFGEVLEVIKPAIEDESFE